MEFDGMGDLIDSLNDWVYKMDQVEEDALKAAALPILEEAKRSTAFHDRSGDLRASLKVGAVKKNKWKGKYILIFTASHHASLVEYGTSRAAARPFLQPAFERHRAEAEQIIKNRLREALK